MKPKISFDFDNTLEFSDAQALARELIAAGYNVCILTTRYSDPTNYPWAAANPEEAKHLHDELKRVASDLGITEINFTEFQWKTTVIDKLGINIHIDDNYREEVVVINGNNKAKAVYYCFGGAKRTRDEVFGLISEYD